jgi:hypothetical protein
MTTTDPARLLPRRVSAALAHRHMTEALLG